MSVSGPRPTVAMSTVEPVDTLPEGPIESDPFDFYRDRSSAEIRAMLDDVLAGVELGAYDRRIVEWGKSMWDQPTMVTIASLIHRARAAGSGESVAREG